MNSFSRFVSQPRRLRWWIVLAALCAASALTWGAARPVSAQDQSQEDSTFIYLPFATNSPTPAPLCRMGVNITRSTTTDFPLPDLRIGWYIDYRAIPFASFANNAAHTPVINLAQVGADGFTSSPSGAALDQAIAAQPGADWIIGNEPDRRFFQNDLEPHVYARAFHDLAQYIRARDPSARLFAGAIVQPTPLRLQYLDLVLSHYQRMYGAALPADGWAIHNFILNERSCSYYNDPYICWGADIPPGIDATDGLIIGLDELQKTADVNFFKEQIVRFRQWMADNGYRNLPLYVSEYGILMPADRGFPPTLVNRYMNDTFDYMLTATSDQLGYAADNNRLVQRFAWYSTLDPSFNGSLFESTTSDPLSPPFRRTTMGDNYLAYANGMQANSEYKLMGLTQLPLSATSGTGISVTLRATLANAGNNQWPAAGRVLFYWGDPTAGGVPLGTADVSLTGCGRTATVDFVWADVPAEANGQLVYARLQAPGVDTQTSVQIVLIKDLLFLPKAKRAG
jgi:hypothetical protein